MRKSNEDPSALPENPFEEVREVTEFPGCSLQIEPGPGEESLGHPPEKIVPEAYPENIEPEISEQESPLWAPSPQAKDQPPDDPLLYSHLFQTTPLPSQGGCDISLLLQGSIQLYHGLDPRNALQSILARIIVATSNATLEDFARAAVCGISDSARAFNTRNGLRGSDAVNRLVQTYQAAQEGSRQSIAVETMNNVVVDRVTVEGGGQAIVGTVSINNRAKKKGHERRKARKG